MTPLAIKTDKNTEKFLMLITATEGTDKNGLPYNVLFGYGTFQGYEKHPEKRIYFTNPLTGKKDFSTAAGRYQINKPTYDSLGMKDFSPEEQDRAAIKLIKKAGALQDVIDGNFESAIKKTNKIWASLPGSPYKQKTWSLKKALQFLGSNPGISSFAIITLIFLTYLIIKK